MALAAAVIGLLGALVRIVRRRPRAAGPSAWIVLPPLASLGLCIATTPVPRYAGTTMWLFGVQSVMLALRTRLFQPLGRRLAVVAALAVAALPFLHGAPLWVELRSLPPNPPPPVQKEWLASGLEVYVASPDHPACWDAPLPCTPRLEPGLRLRRAPDLGSGFVVDRNPPG